ncbi:hypothetical protein F7725_028288 [Dissostichus mawsoni]|uniref:Uncharacterized protein n=1 Tax=Dissostichus mawsoni TaxID=36200 RepID=A0A7J5XFJ2_DISMA|nr:hypothetical protein F7725_028288 [Dissostichus mawsoni]
MEGRQQHEKEMLPGVAKSRPQGIRRMSRSLIRKSSKAVRYLQTRPWCCCTRAVPAATNYLGYQDGCTAQWDRLATGLSVFGSETAPALVVDSYGRVAAESQASACDSQEDGELVDSPSRCQWSKVPRAPRNLWMGHDVHPWHQQRLPQEASCKPSLSHSPQHLPSGKRLRRWSIASSTSSGRPVTVTTFGLTLNSSMILRMPLPRAPMMRAWTLLSRVMSSEIISSSSSTKAWMASRAAMALCSYPLFDALQEALFGAVQVIGQAGDGDFIRLLLRSRHLNINLVAESECFHGGLAALFATRKHNDVTLFSVHTGQAFTLWVLALWELNLYIVISSDLLDTRAFGTHDRTVELLNNHTLNAYAFGLIHTVFGSFEGDLIALSPSAREAHHHATILISKVPEDLATASHKVAMVFWINSQSILNDVILIHSEPYQTLDELLQLLCGIPHGFFGADHSDELLVFVLHGGENDPGPGAVTNLTDVSTTFPYEELVVFRLRTQLRSVTLRLLRENIDKIISKTIIFHNSTSIMRSAQKKIVLTAKSLNVYLRTFLQTFSSAKASSCCLAFSTSSTGPLMVTLSIPEPSVGKWMCTPPHSSMMERTKRPFDPIKELCSLEGMDTSTSVMLAWTQGDLHLAQEPDLDTFRATSQFAFLPVMTIISELLFSAGRRQLKQLLLGFLDTLGIPSIRIRLLFSLSGGMRTVTLCSSLMRLTMDNENKTRFEDVDQIFVVFICIYTMLLTVRLYLLLTPPFPIRCLWNLVSTLISVKLVTYQICYNDFNLALHHLHVFGGTLQGDLIFSLSELNALLGTRDLDLVTGVVGSWDLDFGGSFELELLKLLPIFADDKTMVLLGDGNSSRGLLGLEYTVGTISLTINTILCHKQQKDGSLDLSLQSGHNLLAGLHHGIQLSGNHDGETLIFSQGEFQVGSSLMHDVNTDLRLVSFPKLVEPAALTQPLKCRVAIAICYIAYLSVSVPRNNRGLSLPPAFISGVHLFRPAVHIHLTCRGSSSSPQQSSTSVHLAR